MRTQRRNASLGIIAIALLTSCVWATDSWKNTPYEKWSAKDVQKILNESPWAKPMLVPYSPYLNGDRPETDARIKIGSASDPWEVGTSSIYTQPGLFILRWNSAVTLRRALYRDAVLHGIPADYAAVRYLQDDPEYLELVMVPAAQTFLPPTEESTLLRKTTLQFQPSGKIIVPTNAQVRGQVNSMGQEGYIFDFAKLKADGTSVIPKDTTEIEFFTQVGIRMFTVKFKTKEMTVHNTPDFY